MYRTQTQLSDTTGEMEKITLKASLLAKAEGDLTLWVEEDAT